MQAEIRESEVWALREGGRLSELMRNDVRNAGMPEYATSIPALAVLMAGAFNLPCYRMLAERVQLEHRHSEHGGGRSTDCEACGWFDGAVYKATTGREFVDDFPELFAKLRASSQAGKPAAEPPGKE